MQLERENNKKSVIYAMHRRWQVYLDHIFGVKKQKDLIISKAENETFNHLSKIVT